MKRLDWFKFYPRDFFTSQNVTMMSCFERGVYLQLLGHCWIQDDCSLPADDTALARILGLSVPEWEQVKDVVLNNFKLKGKRLVNKRLLEQREEAATATRHSRAANDARHGRTSKTDTTKTDGETDGETETDGENNQNHSNSRGRGAAGDSPGSPKTNINTNQSPVDILFHKMSLIWTAIHAGGVNLPPTFPYVKTNFSALVEQSKPSLMLAAFEKWAIAEGDPNDQYPVARFVNKAAEYMNKLLAEAERGEEQ